MNNETFLIEEFDLDSAKNICKFIEDEKIRNRAAASVTAATVVKKYFQDYEIDTTSGLHNVCSVLEDIEVSDIYLKDNYIDVRLYFDDKGLFVPKSHIDNNIMPVAYMFIKVEGDLSSALVTGFALPSSIDKSVEYDGYYRVLEEDLVSIYDVESRLETKYEEGMPEGFESKIFDYLDGKLSDKAEFYNVLFDSKEARIKLQKAENAKRVFNFVSIPNSQGVAEDVVEGELLEPKTDELEESVVENSELSLENESFELLEESDDLGIVSPEDVYNEDAPQEIEELDVIDELELQSSELLIEEVDSPIIEEESGLDLVSDSEEELESEIEDLSTEDEDNSLDSDSISMMDAGVYEETFPVEESVETSDSQDDFEINMLDSSNLSFDEDDTDAISPVEEIVEESIIEESVENLVEELPIEDKDDSSVILDLVDNASEEEIVSDESAEIVEFPTSTTPSINNYDNDTYNDEELIRDLDADIIDNVTDVSDTIKANETNNEEQIDTLFSPEESSEEIQEPALNKPRKSFVPILAVVAILGVVGYYSYTKFLQPNNTIDDIQETPLVATEPAKEGVQTPIDEAMPVETVENIKVDISTNEGNSISVPAIENNLDASIAVSNLRVEFEIPAAYRASKTSERYFTKMGKIIQLNLKTELLLLTKQPITNRIAIELEYNPSTHKFDAKGMTATSGDNSIDNVILQTVKNSLDINLSMNMSVFENVKENPVLVIRL